MRSNWFKIMMVLVVVSVVLAACGPTATPEPTQAPAATSAPAATKAPEATAVPATKAPEPTATKAPAPTATTKPTEVVLANPPTKPEDVDKIDLTGKKVIVTYWHNRPQKDQDFLQKMLDEFNKDTTKNPYGITAYAEIAGASYNDVYNKVNAAIQAGVPPSLSVAYQNQAAFYRGQGAVIDLNPFIKSTKYGLTADDLKDFYPTFLASDANPQYKGETLGFPTQRSMAVMYYNADMLAKLGYTEVPKDWKTFEEAACKASKTTGKYGVAWQHDISNFASLVFSNGGRILAEDGKAYVFNSQAGVDSLAMLQRLFANKCAVEVPVSEANGQQTRFGKGDVLFVFGSSSGLPFFQAAVAAGGKFKWDIALLPNSGKPAMNLYGASVSVYKTTPEQELASWLVIKFLSEKEQTSRWAIQTGYFPVRQSAQDDVIAGFKKDTAKWGPVADTYAKMFGWFQYAMIESPVAGYDPVRALMDKNLISKIITDPKADVKALLDAAVADSNKVLAEKSDRSHVVL